VKKISKISAKVSLIIITTLYVLFIVGNVMTVLGGFRYTTIYNIIVIITPPLILLIALGFYLS